MAKLEASRIPIQPPPVTSATTTVQTEDDALLQLQVKEMGAIKKTGYFGSRQLLDFYIVHYKEGKQCRFC
jgi:hypothetical protein